MNDVKSPKLKIISSKNRGTIFILNKKKYSCGRTDSNDIILDDSSVSSSHCELIKNGQTYLIHDLESANGTRVNEILIDEYKLKNNDIVSIGLVELIYDSVAEGKSVLMEAQTGINPDLYNHKTSPVTELKNISPFAKNRNSGLPQLAITTVIALLAVVVLALLVWLFTIYYSQ